MLLNPKLTGDIYSTSEVKTNKKWINGKPIYRKVANAQNITSQNSTIGTVQNLDTLVKIYGNAYNSSFNQKYGIPNTHQDIATYYINALITNNTNITLRFGSGYTGGFQYVSVIVEYTKTTD